MSAIFSVLQMAWRFFTEVQCPFLGISFSSLFLGIMIVNFTIWLLKPLLGIGGSINKSYDRSIGKSVDTIRRDKNK